MTNETPRIRSLATFSVVVSVVALVACVLAVLKWQEALQQTRKAQDLARTAIAASLLASGRPTWGSLAAVEVREPETTPTAVTTLHRALATRLEHVALEGHNGSVIKAIFSPDGTHVLTASSDNTARTWNAENGQVLHTLQGHTDWVLWAAWSPGATRVITASRDNTVRTWNAENGQILHTLLGHTDWIRAAAWSPDATRVLTASRDYTARSLVPRRTSRPAPGGADRGS